LLQIYYNVIVLCFRMRSSQVVIASNSQCRSLNCPGLNPSILRHCRPWRGFNWHFTRNQTGYYRYWPKITFYLLQNVWKCTVFSCKFWEFLMFRGFQLLTFLRSIFKSWHQRIWNQHNIFVFWYPYWYFSQKLFGSTFFNK
jgi:hypothetical protein